jgi:hypothetical protein
MIDCLGFPALRFTMLGTGISATDAGKIRDGTFASPRHSRAGGNLVPFKWAGMLQKIL